MTEEEKVLAEQYHGLIFYFLREHNLDVGEWYGDAALALCEACKTCNTDKKESFMSYALVCMKNKIYGQVKARHRKKRYSGEHDMSLDEKLVFNNTEIVRDRYDVIEGEGLQEDNIIMRCMFSEYFNSLRSVDQKIFQMAIAGYTHKYISGVIGCSRQNVSERVAKIQNDFKKYYNKY